MTALVWLRSDLRSDWHSPFDYAIENHEKVVALYCLTPEQWQHYHYAPCKVNLLIDRLSQLKTELKSRNISLLLVNTGDFVHTPKAIMKVCQQYEVKAVYFNAEYEWDERLRDKQVKALCDERDITVAKFHDTCIVNPQKILTKQQTPYKMFTPYFNTWLEILNRTYPQPVKPQKAKQTIELKEEVDLSTFKMSTDVESYSASTQDIQSKLKAFVLEKALDYQKNRDFPAIEGTSQISHLLSIGAISAKQCAFLLRQEHHDAIQEPQNGAHVWLKELAWRDFYRYVMFHFTHVNKNLPFQKHYQHFKWETNQRHFEAWKQGETGYPIVDAAMRALKATGWMHNRLRMVVASFYCKHLMLPWRWAEDYFMSQLIDGDFASNNGGWQWSASVGTDAAPYFRIFNPTAQSEKFDPKGEFIKKWVPELGSLSPKHIHQPSKYCDVIKLTYPLPIVDHASSVSRTKTQFKQFIELSQQ